MNDINDHIEMMDDGALVQQDYTTAMAIRNPRKLNVVERRCLEEAAIAGEEFFYSWEVKTKRGPKVVIGLTVGAGLAIVRNWGNCGVRVLVEEKKDSFVFHGQYVDLETGFNLQRPFRQNKDTIKTSEGKQTYDDGRQADIQFQIGASKAIRNVVLNAMPKWLTVKMLAKSQEKAADVIKGMGIEKARGMMITKADNLGVPMERVEASYGKKGAWDVDRLVRMSGSFRALENGEETVETLFPLDSDGVEEKTEARAADLKERLKKTNEKTEKAPAKPAAEKKAPTKAAPVKKAEKPSVGDEKPVSNPKGDPGQVSEPESGAAAGVPEEAFPGDPGPSDGDSAGDRSEGDSKQTEPASSTEELPAEPEEVLPDSSEGSDTDNQAPVVEEINVDTGEVTEVTEEAEDTAPSAVTVLELAQQMWGFPRAKAFGAIKKKWGCEIDDATSVERQEIFNAIENGEPPL